VRAFHFSVLASWFNISRGGAEKKKTQSASLCVVLTPAALRELFSESADFREPAVEL
jgi:hypothetical protein